MPAQHAIKVGAVVHHVTKGFTGRVIGTTRLRRLFENARNAEEYRVQVAPDDIRIAAAESLVVIPPDRPPRPPYDGPPLDVYTNHCRACNGPIREWMERCGACGWFICPECGACGSECVACD